MRAIGPVRGILSPQHLLARVLGLAGCLALAVMLICLCPLADAAGGETATLTAKLTPERLGRSTTLSFGFQISAAAGGVPSPLKQLDVRYPADFGIGTSGLGLQSCTASVLETFGPMGCPSNSFMGHGTVLADVPFGTQVVQEGAVIAVLRAPEQSGHTAILFYAEGVDPVDAFVIFSGLLVPAPPPFEELNIAVPLVPSLPEGPDVSVVRVQSTIGPANLTYYEDLHGKRIAYTPKGILLPARCPRGGFPFAATFGFLGGSEATAQTRVPCPRRKPRHARKHRG